MLDDVIINGLPLGFFRVAKPRLKGIYLRYASECFRFPNGVIVRVIFNPGSTPSGQYKVTSAALIDGPWMSREQAVEKLRQYAMYVGRGTL